MNAWLAAVHGAERGWVWLYTAGMPAEDADRRRGQLEADILDHAQWAAAEAQGHWATLRQAFAAFVFGAPSDVAWRMSLGRKGLSALRRGEGAIAVLVLTGAAVGLPLAVFFGLQGQDWLLDAGGPRWASFSLFLAAVAGTLLFTGIGIFDVRPAAGATLVALSGLCVVVSLWWSPVAVALGAIAAVAAVAAARKMASRGTLDN
ncbi:MAG: hypothetical protein ACRDHF_09845 [Tepidiformaceae bacterium]